MCERRGESFKCTYRCPGSHSPPLFHLQSLKPLNFNISSKHIERIGEVQRLPKTKIDDIERSHEMLQQTNTGELVRSNVPFSFDRIHQDLEPTSAEYLPSMLSCIKNLKSLDLANSQRLSCTTIASSCSARNLSSSYATRTYILYTKYT